MFQIQIKKNRYQKTLFEPTKGREYRNIPCYIAKLKESKDKEVYTVDPITNEREMIFNNSIVEFTYDKKKTLDLNGYQLEIVMIKLNLIEEIIQYQIQLMILK